MQMLNYNQILSGTGAFSFEKEFSIQLYQSKNYLGNLLNILIIKLTN